MFNTRALSKIDPELKAKWVAALRSGDYTQGEGFLQDENGNNCCLGVLARINGVPSGPSINNDADGALAFVFPRCDEHDCGSDNPEDAELTDTYNDIHQTPDGYCGIDAYTRDNLINRNDGHGVMDKHSFAELADFIEENL